MTFSKSGVDGELPYPYTIDFATTESTAGVRPKADALAKGTFALLKGKVKGQRGKESFFPFPLLL
jgi:hypothetical protein